MLREAGIFSGMACRELLGEEFKDFVNCLDAIAGRTDIDGLYVFADFVWEDYTPERMGEVRRIVRDTGVRLYLETVESEPPDDLAALAYDSRGGVIHTSR